MDNQYLSVIKEDAELYGVVKEQLPELQRLSATQVERFVFYLKSLHTYYPKSENHTAFWSDFEDKLTKIRNSAEQVELQRRASANNIKAIAMFVFAGLLLGVALALCFADNFGIAIGFFLAAGALIVFADTRFIVRAINLYKEQDRKYFRFVRKKCGLTKAQEDCQVHDIARFPSP
ncbi:hypothetical protein KAF44_30325 (plasmid) [Cupriavidus necator]|nr:hypothetical protein KAF44_30325 [Cupriavidus necator]